jgi:hypothetical protein
VSPVQQNLGEQDSTIVDEVTNAAMNQATEKAEEFVVNAVDNATAAAMDKFGEEALSEVRLEERKNFIHSSSPLLNGVLGLSLRLGLDLLLLYGLQTAPKQTLTWTMIVFMAVFGFTDFIRGRQSRNRFISSSVHNRTFKCSCSNRFTTFTCPLDHCILLALLQACLLLTVLAEIGTNEPLGDTLNTAHIFSFGVGVAVREVWVAGGSRGIFDHNAFSQADDLNAMTASDDAAATLFFVRLLAMESPSIQGGTTLVRPSRKEIYMRFAFHAVCNNLARVFLMYTLPMFLVHSETAMDLVKDAVALQFIITLDDKSPQRFEISNRPKSRRNQVAHANPMRPWVSGVQ